MGHIIAGSEWRWPDGVIPYTINDDDFPSGNPELVGSVEATLADGQSLLTDRSSGW